jgi:hypothetical protein
VEHFPHALPAAVSTEFAGHTWTGSNPAGTGGEACNGR